MNTCPLLAQSHILVLPFLVTSVSVHSMSTIFLRFKLCLHPEYTSAAWTFILLMIQINLIKCKSSSVIYKQRLQAHHASFRTCMSVRMAVCRQMQEKCSFVSVLQGSAWTGSYPHEQTSASYKVHSILWN